MELVPHLSHSTNRRCRQTSTGGPRQPKGPRPAVEGSRVSAGQSKAVVIPIERAKAALEHLKQRHQQQVDELRAEISALRSEATNQTQGADFRRSKSGSSYNNAPSKKRGKKYQRQLAKVRAAVESGELSSLGRASIKRCAECGDTVTESLQVDLVDMGLARRTAGGQVRLAA